MVASHLVRDRWVLSEGDHVGQNSVESGSTCVLLSHADDSGPLLVLQLLPVQRTDLWVEGCSVRRYLAHCVRPLLDLTLDLILNMARTCRDLALIELLDLIIVLVLMRALILASGAVIIAVLLVHGVVQLIQFLEAWSSFTLMISGSIMSRFAWVDKIL